MNIYWHGHSFVRIVTEKDQTILIDPFITGNATCDLSADEVDANYILLTHAHEDHVGDTEAIAKRTGAQVVAPVELASYLGNQGLDTHGMQMGGKCSFDFGTVKMTQAIHGSSLEIDGKPFTLGLASGLILTIEGKTIYHAGDTALFSDMKLIGEFHSIDLAFLPIGDNFTMGPEDAVHAAHFIQAKKVVPVHYNTFPLIEQDPQAFVKALPENVGIALDIGQNFSM